MVEPKPLASLTSGLLARKGAALPAMRRPVLGSPCASASTLQDDLGRNDMDFNDLAAIARAPAGRKAAFTLRLDADRHSKLRLASAIEGRSAQHIVTQALDIFLKARPEIDRMAQQRARKSASK
ncbi:hypothetical protein WG907_05680 [Sphingobium sp. AN558]|uniref:hypothetical protein n=1 Tax=Sphingobium sp. AN558 TaxID=3133442 RepID=UPI0030BCB767